MEKEEAEEAGQAGKEAAVEEAETWVERGVVVRVVVESAAVADGGSEGIGYGTVAGGGEAAVVVVVGIAAGVMAAHMVLHSGEEVLAGVEGVRDAGRSGMVVDINVVVALTGCGVVEEGLGAKYLFYPLVAVKR